MTRLLTATVFAGLLASGTAAAIPPGDPPSVTAPGLAAPPAAWIETATGDHWLFPRNWVWCSATTGLCAGEPVAALTPSGFCQLQVFGYQEEAPVAPGETVRLHLAFTPEAATVAFGQRVESLTPGQDLPWTVSGSSGGLVLRAKVGPSSVDYRVRLVVGSDSTAPTVRTLGAVKNGHKVFLRVRTSEPVTSTGCITSGQPSNVQTRRLFSKAGLLRLPPASVPAGVRLIPVGRLPTGDYTVRLRFRDRTGNTTLLEQSLRITPEGASLLGRI